MDSRTGFSIIFSCVLMVLGGRVIAQPDSPAQLRQEIAELERTATSLRSALQTVTVERDRLLAEVAQLRRAISDASSQPLIPDLQRLGQKQEPSSISAEPTVPISALSQDPLSSPDALFVSLLLEYREAFAALDAQGGRAIPDESAVQAWVETMRSKLDGSANWLLRINGIMERDDDLGEPMRIRATVLDPFTMRPRSRETVLTVPSRFEGRFPDAVSPAEGLFCEMRLKIRADPVFQPDRVSAGPFNFPPFIGPYAAFDFSTDPVGIRFLAGDQLKPKQTDKVTPVDR